MSTNPWFRMYFEFAFDPKVQSMDETSQRRFVIVLCLKCNGDIEKLTDDEIAFVMRITPEELAKTKQLFIDKGFIDDKWTVLHWDKRQYKSDSSKERTRKWRKKQKENVTETSPKQRKNKVVTPPDTDTYNNFSSDSDEYRLSSLLFELIQKNNPNAKQPNLKAWAKHIDLAMRRDNRTVEDLEDVIEWCQRDSFWSANILSTQKLRDKFDQLYTRMTKAEGGGKPKTVPVGIC